jgi:hypothetical protein
MPRPKHNTTAAVLGPTPGKSQSHFFAWCKGMSFRKDMSKSPRSFFIDWSTFLILGAFTFDNPPIHIVSAIWMGSASATEFQLSKESTKFWYALKEFISEVCWDKIVKTNSDIGLNLGSQTDGP